MAEDTAPVESSESVSPATADNETISSDAGSYDESPSESSSTTTDTPLWERLGYDSEEALEHTHTRYKQQVSGSQSETQRLRDEIAARDQRLNDFERRWQSGQGTTPGGQPLPATSCWPNRGVD